MPVGVRAQSHSSLGTEEKFEETERISSIKLRVHTFEEYLSSAKAKGERYQKKLMEEDGLANDTRKCTSKLIAFIQHYYSNSILFWKAILNPFGKKK